MKGSYQNKNINTAILALKKIKSIDLDENQIRRGIKNINRNTKLIGRWQIVKEYPTIIFDVAHNINSLEIIFSELKKIKGLIRVVFGTLDKIDQLECLKVFPKNYIYYLCSPKSKRAMHLDKLEKYADQLKIDYQSFDSTSSAFQKASKDSSKDDTIVVTGSNYLFSEITLENN